VTAPREIQAMTRSTRILHTVLAGLALATGQAIGQAQAASADAPVERIAVTEIKPLLMLAAERGEAHGVLGGSGADYVRRKFDAATPIEVDVRRLHALAQPGCGRLEVTTHQRGVLENGSRHDQELVYQLSFCSDGRFPEKR
jgi:hypothetical protein